jgi:hypothetical protein
MTGASEKDSDPIGFGCVTLATLFITFIQPLQLFLTPSCVHLIAFPSFLMPPVLLC